MFTPRSVLALSLAVVACSNEPTTFAPPRDAAVDVTVDVAADGALVNADVAALDRAATDGPATRDDVLVYAHTSSELFRVDPRALSVRSVGRFAFAEDGQNHEMTDIAINAAGELWGLSFDAVYRIDAMTARCTLVSPLEGQYNGLTFVPAGVLNPASEVLLAVERGGAYFVVNTRDGRVQRLGSYGVGGSSGDLVSIATADTWAIVKIAGVDNLARVDLRAGRTTVIGPTGIDDLWGLGYWRQRLYGFASTGEFVTIDPATGRATVVMRTSEAWWGAGVTTLAPTAPP